MKILKLSFGVLFFIGVYQIKAQTATPNQKIEEEWMKRAGSFRSTGIEQNNTAAKTYSFTCPSSPLTMLVQDTTNFFAHTNTYMPNGATVNCNMPFVIQPYEPATLTSTGTDLVAPCINAHYNPYSTNLNNNGSMHVFEGGVDIVDYCKTGCGGDIQGGVGINGSPLDAYLSFMDTSKAHMYQFCKTGSVGTVTS